MSKITNERLNPVLYRMLHSCTHMATVGVKGLNRRRWIQYTVNFVYLSRRRSNAECLTCAHNLTDGQLNQNTLQRHNIHILNFYYIPTKLIPKPAVARLICNSLSFFLQFTHTLSMHEQR